MVLVSSSELVDRDNEFLNHRPYLVIADFLTRNSYAVFRHDDRGFGQSTGDAYTATDDDFVADSAAALNWLRKQKTVATNSVGFIGHAHGGVKAALASLYDKPDFIILLGTGVQSIYEILVSQKIDIETAELLSANKMKQQSEELKIILSSIRKAKDYTQARQSIMKYASENGADKNAAEEIASAFATPWLKAELDKSPVELFKNHQGPVLALYAEKDLVIDSKLNADLIRPLLGHSASEVRILPKLNHYFQPSSNGLIHEMWETETTFDQSALNTMLSWLEKITNAEK